MNPKMRLWGLGLRVEDLGFRAQGLGFTGLELDGEEEVWFGLQCLT